MNSLDVTPGAVIRERHGSIRIRRRIVCIEDDMVGVVPVTRSGRKWYISMRSVCANWELDREYMGAPPEGDPVLKGDDAI